MKVLSTTLAVLFLFISLHTVHAQEMHVTFKEIKDSNAAKNYVIDISYPQVDFGPEALMGMRGVASDINSLLDTLIAQQINEFKTSVAETNVKMEGAVNELDIKSSVTNTAGSFLSVLMTNFTYIVGSAHPMTTYLSFNYSILAGGPLNISNLFLTNSGYLKYISDYCIKSLKDQQTKMGVNIDNDWVKKGAGPDTSNFRCFNITDDSLIITFNAYQVAPYYVGAQTAEIPLSKMKDMLDPKGPLSYLLKD